MVLCQINQLFFFCFLCLLWADIDGYDNHKVKGQLLSIYREDDPNRLALKWSDAGKETAGYNPGTFYAVFLVFVSQLDWPLYLEDMIVDQNFLYLNFV